MKNSNSEVGKIFFSKTIKDEEERQKMMEAAKAAYEKTGRIGDLLFYNSSDIGNDSKNDERKGVYEEKSAAKPPGQANEIAKLHFAASIKEENKNEGRRRAAQASRNEADWFAYNSRGAADNIVRYGIEDGARRGV